MKTPAIILNVPRRIGALQRNERATERGTIRNSPNGARFQDLATSTTVAADRSKMNSERRFQLHELEPVQHYVWK